LRGQPSPVEKYLLVPYLRRIGHNLADAYLRRAERYLRVVNLVLTATAKPTAPPYILAVQLPQSAEAVSRLEKDRQTLVRAAATGMQAVFNVFGLPHFHITEILAPYSEDGQLTRQ
jgi:hypothetical protein